MASTSRLSPILGGLSNFDLRKQIAGFLAAYPKFSAPPALVFHEAARTTDVLDALARMLAIPAFTTRISTDFRPLLMDLCARWLKLSDLDDARVFEAFGSLIGIHEEIYPIMCEYFSHPKRAEGPLAFIIGSIPDHLSPRPLHRLLLAYYRILRVDDLLPTRLFWSLSPLTSLINMSHPDSGVRFLAIRCYSLQAGMSEHNREKAEISALGTLGGIDMPIGYGEHVIDNSLESQEIDGWNLTFLEEERILKSRKALLDPPDFFTADSPQLSSSDLCPYIVSIADILLFRKDTSHPPPSPLVYTPGVAESLRSLALHISQRLPALLTSPPGAGKTLVLQYLAQQLFPSAKSQVVTLHLADTSIDPKSLLGSHVSSSTIPGTFQWVEGVLTTALREGKWLVLEDIDKASSEVLGTIVPLVQSLCPSVRVGAPACINIPGKGKVVAREGFALFATRSVITSAQPLEPLSAATFLGHQHWSEIVIPSPSTSEQETILSAQFPRLAGASIRALILVFDAIQGAHRALTSPKGRAVGLRDLIKWTQRVNELLPPGFPNRSDAMDLYESHVDADISAPEVFSNPAIKELIFLEAQDIFFGSGPPNSSANGPTVSSIIAKHLGLSSDRAEWVLNSRTPELETEKSPHDERILSVRVGRTSLSATLRGSLLQAPAVGVGSPRPFAIHRPSLLLLEKLAVAVRLSEPLLLVGETGTGKTSTIQHLASLLSHPLTVLNLSHQTEASDLLGGFKPLDVHVPVAELQRRFSDLFSATFSLRRNVEYGDAVRKAIHGGKWKRVVALWRDAKSKAVAQIQASSRNGNLDSDAPRKRRRVEDSFEAPSVTELEWNQFEADVTTFEAQHVLAKTKLAFSFVEGPLVRALRAGHWVLLDEMNLASSETLEAITPLLHSSISSLTLAEQGSLEPVPRHTSFRLFASMNPATDVGKKDLPPVLRSNFTEIWVPPPDTVREALLAIIQQYIGHVALSDRSSILDVAEYYEAVRKLADSRQISDGSNHRPHFSMRTLTRALTFASDVAPTFGLRRALWEGCLMSFTMMLETSSAEAIRPIAERHLLSGVKNKRALLSQTPALPPGATTRDGYVQVGPFFLRQGPLPLETMDEYILTPSVQSKLIDLSRIILTRRFPVLIEGPTSAGKTSSIEYLARRTGHRFVRVNNHEHTDIQEYIGTYISDPISGKLVFQDGILVRALRRGDWIVLDELNLAPTDVLEALNRLLDDNRELLIPETQEIITPHPNFMLFATQNPPGLYAGRKVLSRAFRNRFLEVHFDDVPQAELETILCQRCRIAPSYAQRIVAVFRELQNRRQAGRVFESKHGFATLRDLFRWAGRDALGYQQLAENGYMLLAERARRSDDKKAVKEAIESVMKVTVDPTTLYLKDIEGGPAQRLGLPIGQPSDLVWTSAFRRLFILVASAVNHHEPVLLVGDTGTGKTSVCQYLAEVLGRRLYILNCHQNTETADLLGGLRPVRNRAATQSEACLVAANLLRRNGVDLDGVEVGDVHAYLALVDRILHNKSLPEDQTSPLREARRTLQQSGSLFEWHDGPLVKAMQDGDLFLLDEISLADDSVLERLNSVLEPSRTLVLAEKGGYDVDQVLVGAQAGFELVSTMNPGGDYGKKELSPALRNRFTEIWVPQVDDREDRKAIVDSMWQHPSLHSLSDPLLDFAHWMGLETGDDNIVGLRDITAWVTFSNHLVEKYQDKLSTATIFHHAAHMTTLDGLGSLSQLSSFASEALSSLKRRAIDELHRLVPLSLSDATSLAVADIAHGTATFSIGPFAIGLGPIPKQDGGFNIDTPTTRHNAMRILRACQVRKPILLEGSPGVGKTSLITALAFLTGHNLCRVNLSDQTDIMDLFGSDLPVEGGRPGEFQWKDAAFLRALQNGDWVLLDEMNLAPQAVLEGLNAVLDHRGSVYLPELGRTFIRHPEFRIFAAQNPLQQGGGRKGLPKSFLNRFTKVYLQELNAADLLLICQRVFPGHPVDRLKSMITMTNRIQDEVSTKHTIGRDGGPWEFNLRDILRWMTLINTSTGLEINDDPGTHLDTIFLQRFRSMDDRRRVVSIFNDIFPERPIQMDIRPWPSITPEYVQIGHAFISRLPSRPIRPQNYLLQGHLAALQAAGVCIQHGWLVILTGPSGVGKTSLVSLLSDISGSHLEVLSMNGSIDTADLLGGFEQVDLTSDVRQLARRVLAAWDTVSASSATTSPTPLVNEIDSLRKALADTRSPFSSAEVILQYARAACQFFEDSTREEVLAEVDALSDDSKLPGRFDWVDGPLVSAMKAGHWMLLDNANLCNPAVLDRLNSLCEPNGSLTVSERGLVEGEVQILRPHPNFRLLMTVDPRYGELSRAMRNRGLEIALYPPSGSEDLSRLSLALRSATTISTTPRHKHVLSSQLFRRGLTRDPSPQPTSLIGRSFSGALDGIDITTRIATLNADVCVLPASSSRLEALILHHVRTSSPDNWARMTRTIPDVLGWLSPAECAEVTRVLVEIRSSSLFALITASRQVGVRSLPSTFRLAQPLDASVNPNLSENISFLAFELLVRTAPSGHNFLDVPSNSILGTSLLLSKRKPITSEVHPVVKELAPLILSARAAAQHILVTTGAQSEDMNSTLLAASYLLDYSDQLRDIGVRPDLDLTAVRLIVSWFSTLTLQNNIIPDDLQRLVQSIHLTTLLKTGLCMGEIWTAFLYLYITPEVSGQISRLNVLASRVQSNPTAHAVRNRLLEVMSMLALNQSANVAEKNDILQLAEDINNKQEFDAPGQFDPLSVPDATCLLLTQLEAISAQPRSSYAVNCARFLVSMACQIPATDLSRYIPSQIELWKWDITSGANPGSHERTSMIIDWEKNIWALPGTQIEVADGPANLMRPVALMCSIYASDLSSCRLGNLPQFESVLRRQHSYTLLQCHDGHRPRQQQLLNLFFDQVIIVIRIIRGAYPESVLSRMETIAATCHNGINRTDALEFSTLLQKTENPFVKNAFLTHLCPTLTRIGGADSSSTSWEWLGDAWISLSLCLIHLYIPDGPLDPLIVQECERDHFLSLERRLRNQMEVIRNMEELVTGNGSNQTLHDLGRRLHHVEGRLSSVGLSPVHRVSDVTRLNSVFQEISQFSAQILPRLPSLSLSNQNPKSSWASNTEVVLQGTISGFIQRLESGYADLHDIVHPLVWSLNQLRLGLRIGICAREVPMSGEQEQIVHAFLAFPSVEAIRRSRLVTSMAAPLADVEWSLHCIAGIHYQAVAGSKLESQSLELKHHYDFMLSLWLRDREKERQEMVDSSSLYRQRKHDEIIVDDAEAEEQDFRSMFPQFEDESLPVYPVKSQATPGARFVSGPQMLELARLHGSLFQSSPDPHYPSLASYQIRRRLAVQRQYAQGRLAVLSPILDAVSLCWRLSLLSDRIRDLDTTDLNYNKPYDFYTDSNVPEVRKAISVLKELRARLQSITLEWPDQMVLQNLLERVQKILDLGLQTPVAGVLASLERLLMHTDDWESYANRENTLKPHQQQIIELIVNWRRLELRCWAQLLAVQEQIFIDGTSEWWFRLYELLVQGTIAASESARNGATQALDEHVSRLTPLLDEYMTSSPLGQFRPRLDLLQSFARYLDLIAITSEKHHSVALKRLARIAHTITKHYEYALPAIMDDLTRGRTPLEKEIRDYIKLASWKDVNVLALKQSAERTHRQLHKCIHKFRDILRASINPSHLPRLILDDTNLVVLESIGRPRHMPELSALPSIDTRGDGPKHLKHLSLTLERFTNVLSDDVLTLFNDEASQFVDVLAIQIITTAQSLADAPVTGSAEEKQKATKTLVMRKRRALMDLLKEMKRIGVSPNLKPDLLAQQQSRSHLLESGVSVDGFDPNLDAAIKKGNLYYHRLINGLQFVRDSLHSHHSDLSTRELQRTLMFTESAFSYGYSLRQKFLKAKDCFVHLRRVSDRLSSLLSGPSGGIARVGRPVVAQVEDTALFMGEFVAALQELMVECRVYDQTRGDEAPLSERVLGRLRDHLDATGELKTRIFGLRERVTMNLGSLLLHSEETLLRACQNHLQLSVELLLESASEEPRIRHLCRPIHDWMKSVSIRDLKPLYAPLLPHAEDDLINSLLVVAQELRGWANRMRVGNQEDGENFMRHKSSSLEEAFQLLRFDIIRLRVHAFLENLALQPSSIHAGFEMHQTSIARVRPFLEAYVNIMHAFMIDASAWMKSVFKLAYIVCSIIQTLAEKGFCKPPDDDPPTDGMENGQALEGIGLGDGMGAEDVSKEIEEESQVEGLKGDDTTSVPKGGDQSDAQDAIEMSQDFDGAMEDVDQPKDDEHDGDSDKDSQPDAEDQIGDVDPTDPDAVDEKLWGDETLPEQSPDRQTAEDRSTQKSSKESEIVAKENDAHPKETKKEGPEQEVDDTTKDDDNPLDKESEGLDETSSNAPDAHSKLDDYVKDADALDLPDDMNLDPDNDDPEVDEDLNHQEEADSALSMEIEPPGTEDRDQEDRERGEPKQDDDTMEDAMEEGGGPDPQASAVADEEVRSELGKEDGDDDRRVEQPRSKLGITGGVDAVDSVDHTDGTANDELASRDNIDGKNPASDVAAQEQTNDQREKNGDPLATDESTPIEISQNIEGNGQHGTAMADPGSSESKDSQSQNMPIPNPLRSLGDALKEIRRRFDDIALRREDVTLSESTANRTDEDKEASQLEYLGLEDHDEDMQALGPSGDDAEASRLRDLRITDEEKRDEPYAPANLEMETLPEIPHDPASTLSHPKLSHRDSTDRELEGALAESHHSSRVDLADEWPYSNTEELAQELPPEPPNDEYVELQLREWQVSGQPDAQAHELWRLYDSLTHDLAYALCEQLRLILEATLATRLKGDYRTGKRLNMKKIIPYIASEYTKDKIWLRRTRPSKREYQILIALDDSKSMRQGRAGHLAFETMALVIKALGRLEAGDVGIVKFGETVDILHGFQSAGGMDFTDQDGAKVMRSFKFDQRATNVLSLLESSLTVLADARDRRTGGSSSAADLWQLEIIISDGICQDHDKLKSVLRRATEQRIMIVFIVVDALRDISSAENPPKTSTSSSSNSILSMNQAQYTLVNGKMELRMQRYLDTFPFEFYVVLRNVEALPDVLAGTLKQFFERISED